MPPHLTVEELLGAPARTAASISPDGTRLAYLAPWRGRLNVWIEGLDSGEEARCVTADDHRSVHTYHWTRDPRWLLYEQDGDGDENWHLYRVDLGVPGAPAVDLTPYRGAKVLSFELPVTRPGTAIVQLNPRDPAEFDLYELDIATGELTLLARNPGASSVWLWTPGGLYTCTPTPEGNLGLSRWDPEAGTSRPVVEVDAADYPMGVHPFQVTPDGTGVWLGSYGDGDRVRLVRVDLATGAESEVDAHPVYDVDTRAAVITTLPSPLIRDRRTGELIGVRYLGERQEIRPLDPHFAAVLKNLEALSDGDVSTLSSDESGRRWVVAFSHDRDPGATYFYDHTTGESRLLFRPYPELDPAALAPMTPITIEARDGRRLPAYLTLPVGAEPRGLPLVLLVHGGPWTRNAWGFNPLVQLLANRGYAVLQVNFRGSTGYGKTHMQAGIGELAGKMHDDLIDAVEWAIGVGYADRERVAIFGGSYGGYAALVGAAFTPDVFAAAVDCFGICDLANFLRTVPEFAKPHLFNNWYLYAGDPDDPEQAADLWARSPISRVDRIRTPLLVVQGANDVRVVRAESDRIVAALRERGVDVEYLVRDDEGHGFDNTENVIEMYRAADRFLARHLGAGA